MSLVYSKSGVVFGTKSRVAIYDASVMDRQTSVTLLSTKDTRPPDDQADGDVAIWGENNLLPQELTRDIESTGILSAAIEAKARIAIGKGPVPARVTGLDKHGYEELEFIHDPEISDWLEMNNSYLYCLATAKDLFGYGNAFSQILLSRGRDKILGFRREDVTECRFSKRDQKNHRSKYVYLSADWSQWMSYTGGKDGYMDRVPLLDINYPLFDLQSRTDAYAYMVALQYPLTGRKYYANAPWRPSRKWVKIAQGIPDMKAAMFDNQMTIKYLVEIHELFWEKFDPRYTTYEADKKKQVMDEFYSDVDEYLTGGKNAYKSIFSTTILDKATQQSVPGIKITAVDDKIKDGKLLPDAGAANSEILFTLMMNPALMGADMPGGPYSGGAGSGSNIREAYIVQVMLNETERRFSSTVFNLAKKVNGWDPSLVLRFPNQILTTLNTGANTQPTA